MARGLILSDEVRVGSSSTSGSSSVSASSTYAFTSLATALSWYLSVFFFFVCLACTSATSSSSSSLAFLSVCTTAGLVGALVSAPEVRADDEMREWRSNGLGGSSSGWAVGCGIACFEVLELR